MLFFATRPILIMTVHTRLPDHARTSREALFAYAREFPADAELQVSWLNFFGIPRGSAVKINELALRGRGEGMLRLSRKPPQPLSFSVSTKSAGDTMVPGLWRTILERHFKGRVQ